MGASVQIWSPGSAGALCGALHAAGSPLCAP
jgi:hypothetical protein